MIDWVKLWILNEVVLKPAKVTRLIEAHQIQPEPYWDFPGKEYFEACNADRLDRVKSLIEKGYLSLFQHQENAFPIPYVDQDFFSANANVYAAISRSGFEQWTDQFCPDWSRYWTVIDESFDTRGETSEVLLFVSSLSLLDELRVHFPMFHSYPHKILKFSHDLEITYATPVGCWKSIPFGAIIRCIAFDVHTEGRSLFAHCSTYTSQYIEASRTLNRLSAKWGCNWVNPAERSFASSLLLERIDESPDPTAEDSP